MPEVAGPHPGGTSHPASDAICILQPQRTPALVACSPPAASLAVDALEIGEATEVIDGSSSVEARYADSTNPQPSKPETVSRAAVRECASPQHSAANKSDLNLMDRYGGGRSRPR